MDNCTKAGLKSKGLFPIAKKKKSDFFISVGVHHYIKEKQFRGKSIKYY